MINNKNNIGDFINCYNGSIEGYYLDLNDEYYKSCYYTCKTCDKFGNDTNHNCLKCKSEYELNKNINGYYNCYTKCDNYYYFNEEGTPICLEGKKCPDDFNKLVPERELCINNCSEDSDYPFEFRNTCYSECPKNISFESDNKFCEVICTKSLPLEIAKYQNCTNSCGINDINDKKCISKYEDEETNANLILQNILKDIITPNFNRDILYNKESNITIKEVNTTFIIATNKILKNNENRLINLGK